MFPRLKEINKELERIKLRKLELSSLEYYGIKNVEDELNELDRRYAEISSEKKRLKTDILLVCIFVLISTAVIIAAVYAFKILIDFGIFGTTGGKIGAALGIVVGFGLLVLICKRFKIHE